MSIILTDLNKRYGEHIVVNRVSLQVEDGELFVLLGGSGSGKTTVLRMVAGLIAPDGGKIELNGRDVTFLTPQARNVGYVFQNYSIFRHMTVQDNVEFGLRIRGVRVADRHRRAEELLDLVGLAGLGSRFADELSGGQQQRVALARALAYQPAVLLLDEPFGALDVKIRAQLRASLKEIQQQLHVTTILVTHDQEEAFELANRIGVMDTGRLIEIGSPEKLYHEPETEFTATFIGGGNVVVGRKEREKIQLGSTVLPLPGEQGREEEGAPIRILFRPETTLLQADPFPQDSGVHVLGQGTVVEQVFAGALRRVILEVEGLRGVRTVAPRLTYGQSVSRLEVISTSDNAALVHFAPGTKLWVGLRDFHVLSPAGLKVLLCVGSDADTVAADFGTRLAQATHGPATLLTVVNRPELIAGARTRLEAMRDQLATRVPNLELRVRQGNIATEILLESQVGHYEVIAVRQDPPGGTGYRGLGDTSRQVLEQADVPVLLVKEARPEIRHILICTRGGEPGKTDITFGGRVARRAGAAVTVLNVQGPQATAEERRRAARHLRQAEASLSVQGVRCKVQVREGNIVERIVEQAEADDTDMIVIGAQAPRERPRLRWQNLATQIVGGSNRPIMIVPMRE